MQIKNMFEKDIDRDIKGVIKVGQNDDENIYQELDEYVVTNELLKHFTKFFSSYNKGIQSPTDDIGVWISQNMEKIVVPITLNRSTTA